MLEANLFDGVSLISALLRIEQYEEAASVASQLLAHFPHALPLHVAVGRALLALPQNGGSTERAIGHFRKVLDADPENWRVRLETALLYLRGTTGNREQAGEELWLAAQSAPNNRWLQEMITRLPDHSFFRRTRAWIDRIAAAPDTNAIKPGEDDGGVARLYLRRNLPWMAVQYFDAALKRLSRPQKASRTDLKTGLLQALYLNGETKKASALASEMLLDQPQLIFPRLLLTSHLGGSALRNTPESLIRLIEPVWRSDPFLVRSTEILYGAGLTLPESLWPQSQVYNGQGHLTLGQLSTMGFSEPVQIRLGPVDRKWLDELIDSSREQAVLFKINGGSGQVYYPHKEVSFSLAELEGPVEAPAPGSTRKRAWSIPARTLEHGYVLQKGSPRSPIDPRINPELLKVADSLARVEEMLFGKEPQRRSTTRSGRNGSKPKRRTAPKGAAELSKGGGLLTRLRPGDAPAAEEALPAAARRPVNSITASLEQATERQLLKLATTLVISSERALSSKYGAAGFGRINSLLEEMVETMRSNGHDARLLLVDSPESLRRNGYPRLNPVQAFQPERVRDLINAALPLDESTSPSRYPDTVFIIGGPEIVPYWKVANPSFDSDAEVNTDNPYGSRDQTYLLPERIVGRLPDDCGPTGDTNPQYLMNRIREVTLRHRARIVPHAPPSFPLRMMEAFLPNNAKLSQSEEQAYFEQEWLRSTLDSGEQFLDKTRSTQLAPFFYSAEAWKDSTETLRTCMGGNSRILFSPPSRAAEFDGSLLARSRLLHFNLHGFRDTGNWYGQSAFGRRIVTSPSLSSLPVAFSANLTGHLQTPGTVIFSEACYGANLIAKGVEDSIGLSLLGQGSAVFVGSTMISYGSAGPELSCAGHLAYYFWKEVLSQGSSFGRALQAAKISYARERLAAGHNLTGDDAKTLLEFVLLGDPTVGLKAVSPAFFVPSSDLMGNRPRPGSTNLPKGGLLNALQKQWEEEQTLRGGLRRVWDRFARPKEHYQPVSYAELSPEMAQKIDQLLKWLLPDPVPLEGEYLQSLIDMGTGYTKSGKMKPPTPPRFAKGGRVSAFADWFEEEEDGQALPGSMPHLSLQRNETELLLAGQRPLKTTDGRNYNQTFHLSSDLVGQDIAVNLSKGKG